MLKKAANVRAWRKFAILTVCFAASARFGLERMLRPWSAQYPQRVEWRAFAET